MAISHDGLCDAYELSTNGKSKANKDYERQKQIWNGLPEKWGEEGSQRLLRNNQRSTGRDYLIRGDDKKAKGSNWII